MERSNGLPPDSNFLMGLAKIGLEKWAGGAAIPRDGRCKRARLGLSRAPVWALPA